MNLGQALMEIHAPKKHEPVSKQGVRQRDYKARLTREEGLQEILDALDSPKTVLELADELNLTRTPVRDRLAYLLDTGKVKRHERESAKRNEFVYWRAVK